MPDVNLDSRFDWGPVRLGFEEMGAFARTTTRGIAHDIQTMFVGVIAVDTVINAFRSISDEVHEINVNAQRFRLDAQELQTIGAAAREVGIPLETVARTMNMLELNAYKATQADNEQRQALEDLGISANDFFKLNADEKILALSDAYNNASDKAKAYAQILLLVGTRNAAIMPLIQQTTDQIRAQGDAAKYTAEQLREIERARVEWEHFWHDVKVFGAEFFTTVVNPILDGLREIDTGFANLQRDVLQDFKNIGAGIKEIFSGDIVGGLEQILTGASPAQKAFADEQERLKKMMVTPPTGPGVREAIEGEGGGAGASRKAAEDSLKEQLRLSEQLAKVQRDNAFEQLSDQGKLEALQRELNALHFKALDFSVSDEEHTKALVAEEQKRGEILKLQGKMEQDQVQYDEQQAKIRQQMADQANQELADSQEATHELQLQLAGRKDLAERAKIEYEFNQKIHDAQNAITEAEKQGFNEVANTNRALVTQLSLEKQNALAAHDKAVAEERAKKAAEEAANVEQEQNKLAEMRTLYSMEETKLMIENLRLRGVDTRELEFQAELQRIAFEFNVKIHDTLDAASELWIKMNQAYAEGNTALAERLAEHAQILQAEANELELEKEQTLEIQRQNEELKRQEAARKAEAEQSAAAAAQISNAAGALAAYNLRLGATGDVYAQALAQARGLKPGSPEYNRLVQQIQAEDQLRMLRGETLGGPELLSREKLVEWFTRGQEQRAQIEANKSLQDEIAYWGAIAAGRPAPTGSFFTGLFGGSPFMPTPLTPAPAGTAPMDSLVTQGDKQTQLLQKIADNTEIVKVG